MKASLRLALAMAFFALWIAAAFAQTKQPLTIITTSLESCVVDDPCALHVGAEGGTVPLQWRIVHGSLPPGLQLDPRYGIISGSAATAGDYEVVIEVSDASLPPQKASRAFTVRALPVLAIDWKKPPGLNGTSVSGSVVVSNHGSAAIDLTFIVVAVNEVGKAFALGYQHFDLPPKTKDQEIPFESQLPGGRYTVRADAIGELAARNRIYRAARDAGPFQVPVQ